MTIKKRDLVTVTNEYGKEISFHIEYKYTSVGNTWSLELPPEREYLVIKSIYYNKTEISDVISHWLFEAIETELYKINE